MSKNPNFPNQPHLAASIGTATSNQQNRNALVNPNPYYHHHSNNQHSFHPNQHHYVNNSNNRVNSHQQNRSHNTSINNQLSQSSSSTSQQLRPLQPQTIHQSMNIQKPISETLDLHILENIEYPYCTDHSKYENLAKIGQGTFG